VYILYFINGRGATGYIILLLRSRIWFESFKAQWLLYVPQNWTFKNAEFYWDSVFMFFRLIVTITVACYGNSLRRMVWGVGTRLSLCETNSIFAFI
jgi:hypothetical protein